VNAKRAAALVDAGVFLQLSGDVTGAKELFRQALALDPSNEKARVLVADSQPSVRAVEPPSDPAITATNPLPREQAPGNETRFESPRTDTGNETLLGRPLFPSNPGMEERSRIAHHLSEGAFDKALAVAFNRIKTDPDDVEAHELAWDVLAAAGQTELARAQLGNLMEVAVQQRDVVRIKRFIAELERATPHHPALEPARALLSEFKVVEPDSTLIDEALRSVL
jgi:thioredoxin-like negative regulator of GroEL